MDCQQLTARLKRPTGDPRTASTAVCVENLRFSYDAVDILRGVDCRIPFGRVTCLMGRNGVGKTTLLKNLMGSLTAKAGRIVFDNQTVNSLAANQRARAGFGIVPQGRRIHPHLTVDETLHLGLESRPADPSAWSGWRNYWSGRKRRAGRQAIEEMYQRFPDLRPLARRLGGNLSGGQQQQLAIARALLGQPRILLCDEPTEGIQPNIAYRIGELLQQLAAAGVAVLLVTQSLDYVYEFGDSVYFMDRGQIHSHVATQDLNRETADHYLSI